MIQRIRAFLFCQRGHYWVGTVLPEEEFGLYAFSKMQCRRCGYCDPYFTDPAEVAA